MNVFSCTVVPRTCDRGKAYVYFKGWVGRLFEFERARQEDDVVRVVLLASLNSGCVEGSAKILGVCGQTVRNHLRRQNPQNFLQVNFELINMMKRSGALSKPLTIAVDWHDEMYYGDPQSEGVIGTQPKKGSHYAYRFATASVLLDGERLTLAAIPLAGMSLQEQVKQLLSQIFSLGVKIKLLLFDRGYFSSALINYLNWTSVNYVIQLPAVIRGLRGGEDFTYTTCGHRRKKSEQATFRLVTVKRARYSGGNLKLFIFGTNTNLKPRKMRNLFRKRWGIETSYRMIGKFHAKTTSKLYRIRKLYFYLAVVLYNLWIVLNYKHERKIPTYTLKLRITLSLVLSFLPDLEAYDVG